MDNGVSKIGFLPNVIALLAPHIKEKFNLYTPSFLKMMPIKLLMSSVS